MNLVTADHIYNIGMVNTLLNVHDGVKVEGNNYSSTYEIGSRLRVTTKILQKLVEDKDNGLGLYPVHISVFKNETLACSFDTLVKLSDDVLATINNSDVLTDEKYGFILYSKPTVVERAQTYLRYRHQIDELDSIELYSESVKFSDIAKQLVINNSHETKLVLK